MIPITESYRAARQHAPRFSPAIWLAMAVAAALLLSLAVVAAKSGGLDRLLPKDQLFVPYYTT
jgi:hypothetical protein